MECGALGNLSGYDAPSPDALYSVQTSLFPHARTAIGRSILLRYSVLRLMTLRILFCTGYMHAL
jgi:hypothetical protein